MSGRERLEAEGARRRPTWLALLVAVAVLGGLLVVRLTSPQEPVPDAVRPPASTTGSRPSPAAAGSSWPTGEGLPPGTLFVLASSDVYSIDVASGLVEPMGFDGLEADRTVLTALAPGVLAWSPQDEVRYRLSYAGSPAEPAVGPLGSAAAILPASGEQVWTATQERGTSSNQAWVLTDDSRTTGPRIRIRGLAVPDGSGGLLDVEPTRVRLTGPQADGAVVGTYLIATGPEGLVVDSCTDDLCTPRLVDRESGRTTALGPAAPPTPDRASTVFDLGALSPGNRFLAGSAPDRDSGYQLRISKVAAPSVPVRTIPVGSRPTGLTWLSDRWLVATSTTGLLLYDTDQDSATVPSLPFQQPLQLVFEPIG